MGTIQILLVIAAIVLSIGWYGYRKMCPICHRWNGLAEIKKEPAKTEIRYTTKIRKETIRDSRGRVRGYKEKEVEVPYSFMYQNVTFQCKNKNCNEQVKLTMKT